MALDTKQKRGSAIGISLPFRQWLSNPSGTVVATDRLSLLKLSGAITPAPLPMGAVSVTWSSRHPGVTWASRHPDMTWASRLPGITWTGEPL